MKKLRYGFLAVLSLLIFLTAAGPAHAQLLRTFVSGVGDDTNPCSRTSPCKTLAGTMAKTLVHGEINVLDPGGFGSVMITKSITINGTGATGGIAVPGEGATGVTINITAATDSAKSVVLRGLAINGAFNGSVGVKVVAANKVLIENCLITNFKESGISVATGAVFVRNTIISNNRLGINASGGRVGLNDTSIVHNNGAWSGSGQITRYANVVVFGNASGDLPPP